MGPRTAMGARKSEGGTVARRSANVASRVLRLVSPNLSPNGTCPAGSCGFVPIPGVIGMPRRFAVLSPAVSAPRETAPRRRPRAGTSRDAEGGGHMPTPKPHGVPAPCRAASAVGQRRPRAERLPCWWSPSLSIARRATQGSTGRSESPIRPRCSAATLRVVPARQFCHC